MKARSIAAFVAIFSLTFASGAFSAPTVKQLQVKVRELQKRERSHLGQLGRLDLEVSKQRLRVSQLEADKANLAALLGSAQKEAAKVPDLQAQLSVAQKGLIDAIAVLPVESVWALLSPIYRRFPTSGYYSASVYVAGSYISYSFTRSP